MPIQTVFNQSLFTVVLLFIALQACAENAVVGTGTPASCTETTFNAALALVVNDNQGGTLTFNCGPDPDIILLSSVKNLSGIVTIDGGGKMTLDGQDSTRLFNINPRANPIDPTIVVLQNIDLNRGNSGAQPFGGAILANAGTGLNLNNVTIRNSLASTSGGAIATFGDVTLDINNSRFSGNLAANGGAIATRALMTVTGSSFTNNNASSGEGGAIQSYDQKATIVSCSFVSNGARFGGALFKAFNELVVENSIFSGNSSGDDGGAIYARVDANTRLAGLTLNGNTAARDGGALFARFFTLVERSNFSGNSARAGGAIRMDGGKLSIFNTTLNDNRASVEGAGISALITSTNFGPTIEQITTSNNTVSAGAGGDLAFSGNSSPGAVALLTRSTLMGASASTSGSSIQLSGNFRLEVESSLILARAGTTCMTGAGATISSLGFNIGALGCSLNAGSDAISSSFAGFGLGEFANYGGRPHVYLPLPGSVAIDRSERPCSFDARDKPAPIDGDNNGSVLCDSGAVERQRIEVPAALFRDGFESSGGN